MFQYITIDRDTSLLQGGLTLSRVNGTVQFRDVCFSYPSRPNQVLFIRPTLQNNKLGATIVFFLILSISSSLCISHIVGSLLTLVLPTQTVLDNLSLTLPCGRVTALCGLSGAGKSTVAVLLERFYEPTGGRIYLDDTPLDEFDPSWLRGQIVGFINQEPVLFATTVMENIRYGRPSASDQEVGNCVV